MSEKKQISISSVLNLLKEGKDRKTIREELGISISESKELFQHPKLKGKKPLKPSSIEVVDDTEEENTVETAPTTNEVINTESDEIADQGPVFNNEEE